MRLHRIGRAIACAVVAVIGLASSALMGKADEKKAAYPNMAPVEQYKMERNAEIALAKSAAPAAIANNATVEVMGRKGYETAIKGKNGFVCLVERSWTAGIDDPDFWNPKLRGPICFNPPAVRTYVPLTRMKTELVLAGKSKEQMFAAIAGAFDKKELSQPEPGSMCYMMSKDQYLADADGNWHPHLMFFLPATDSAFWGAGVAGSPVIVAQDKEDRLTIFMVTVGKWSDGTAAPAMKDEN
jgi:hypothetical protein